MSWSGVCSLTGGTQCHLWVHFALRLLVSVLLPLRHDSLVSVAWLLEFLLLSRSLM